MQRHFDQELKDLKDKILTLGSYVEKALKEALTALTERAPDHLGAVFKIEEQVNALHLDIDENCLELLARHSPLAADLRLVLAVVKINNDLERMGDQAVNIAKNSGHYLARPPIKPLIDLPRMAQAVQWMIRNALESLVKGDTAIAREVLLRDDEVDGLKHKIFREVIGLMEKPGADVEQGMNLILISRNLERLGDHATNIAEDVIFVMTGDDIRHQKPKPTT